MRSGENLLTERQMCTEAVQLFGKEDSQKKNRFWGVGEECPQPQDTGRESQKKKFFFLSRVVSMAC